MSLAPVSRAVARLRDPKTIRARCGQVFAAAARGATAHFALDLDALPAVADLVLDTTRAAYPDLAVPFHSRWRHFEAGGRNRWAALAETVPGPADPAERARIRFDLAVVSVLLDAGAGPDWSYRERATGLTLGRSEGLAVASLDMFAAGLFAADRDRPWRADAARLSRLADSDLALGFRVAAHNPMVGLAGRAALLRRLGDTMAARADLFGTAEPRPGALFDRLAAQATDGTVRADSILALLLDAFTPIWPSRLSLDGQPLGDVWRHPATAADDTTDGLVPFHKLSQWLAYSLVEPLEDAGFNVVDLDALTGLPEYRNGGLFIDLGVLRPKRADLLGAVLAVADEPVVEWRALTVILLDRVADEIRRRLGLDATALPLAKILQGGTWAAGRRVAAERRKDGGPPLTVASDGTVF